MDRETLHYDFGMTWQQLTTMLALDRRQVMTMPGETAKVRVLFYGHGVSPWGEGPTPAGAVAAALEGYMMMPATHRRRYEA